MSANPEAFEFLRHKAYAFVNREGKDAGRLHDYCEETLSQWCREEGSGSGLTEAEASQIVAAVTDWTIRNYNPPRRKPERTREERAGGVILAPWALEEGENVYGSATVRNAARITGQSKSTLARHLREQGIAPRRQKKIDALPPSAQRLLQLVLATFPRDRSGLVSLDELGFALWDGLRREPPKPFPMLAGSTRSKRRKTIREYLDLIQTASLGLHFHVSGDTVIVWQGRRLPPYKELGAWLLDEQQRHGMRAIRIPAAEATTSTPFWDDPWLRDILGTYELAMSHYVEDLHRVQAMLRLMRLAGDMLLDTSPILRTVLAARRISTSWDYFPEQLRAAARQIHGSEPDVARHVGRIASILENLHGRRSYAFSPSEILSEMDLMIRYMSPLAERAPYSYARVQYLINFILADIMDADAAPRLWWDLRQQEERGAWTAPSDGELKAWLPSDDIQT